MLSTTKINKGLNKVVIGFNGLSENKIIGEFNISDNDLDKLEKLFKYECFFDVYEKIYLEAEKHSALQIKKIILAKWSNLLKNGIIY